jgi:hypothetical protein
MIHSPIWTFEDGFDWFDDSPEIDSAGFESVEPESETLTPQERNPSLL